MNGTKPLYAAALLCLGLGLAACEPDSPAAGSADSDAGDAGGAADIGTDDADAGGDTADVDSDDTSDTDVDDANDTDGGDDTTDADDLPLCVLGESSLPCRLAP